MHSTSRFSALAALSLMSMSGVAMMAAKGGSAAVPPPPPAPPAPQFTFDTGLEIPKRTVGGGGDKTPTELALKLQQVPVDASFIETIVVPAEVQGDEARSEAFKKLAKQASNRVSGAIRRLRKDDAYKNRNYTVRTVADEKLGFGVRIWREADTAPAAA